MNVGKTLTIKDIVFLHAFPLSHTFWDQLKPIQGYRFIKPDFPGFGSTALTNSGFTLEQASLELDQLLKAKNVQKPFTLVGISMGGYWAFEYYRQFPSQVDQLILISTRPGSDKPEGRQNRLAMAEKVEKEGVSSLPETMIPGLLGKTTLAEKPKIKAQLADYISQASAHAVALAQRAMANRRDQTDLLSQIKARTLILAGREDVLIPSSEAEAMNKAIPNSLLKIFDRVGHLMPLESPNQFQEALEEFLSR